MLNYVVAFFAASLATAISWSVQKHWARSDPIWANRNIPAISAFVGIAAFFAALGLQDMQI